MALGLTQQVPIDDRHTYDQQFLENNLAILFGGRAAEELVLGHMTTGAGNDIEKATELARKMVCEWGMSEKLGPMTFGKKEEQIFLGRDFTQAAEYSESTAVEIDAELRRIMSRGLPARQEPAEPEPRDPPQDGGGAARAREPRRPRHRRSSRAAAEATASTSAPRAPERPVARGPAMRLRELVGARRRRHVLAPPAASRGADGGDGDRQRHARFLLRRRTVRDDARARSEHARRLLAEGADVLDVGGESTRPGAPPVAAADERARVLPVIAALRGRGRGADLGRHDQGRGRGRCACSRRRHGERRERRTFRREHAAARRAARGRDRAHAHAGDTGDHAGGAALRRRGGGGRARSWRSGRPRRAPPASPPSGSGSIPGSASASAGPTTSRCSPGCERIVALGHPVVIGASRKGFLGEPRRRIRSETASRRPSRRRCWRRREARASSVSTTSAPRGAPSRSPMPRAGRRGRAADMLGLFRDFRWQDVRRHLHHRFRRLPARAADPRHARRADDHRVWSSSWRCIRGRSTSSSTP